MQSTKFIDVTRTYLPVDPNSFPINLHGAGKEDYPENKIPVMAYKGYNFLPTSYGYKSYFGTAQSVGIDALTARVDHIFIYQNQGYENILIALTDTGVWTKKGSEAGAWVNDVPMTADIDPNVHFMWTYVIIADILYAYRQGQPSYQKFVHDSITQLAITSVVPNFLNMAAQVGIFRAAGRLAFWDSADSTAWANLDEFADFVPDLETLAGNTVFTEVQGRIVVILSHGPGFIIYATKSIVYIGEDLSSLYQWNPVVISPNCGIAYPRQAAIASPDSLHFAYTNEGLAKIENAKWEIIIPEVTDFLKDYEDPVYVKVLEGRYLFLEILDANYITGLVQISDEIVPGVNYAFPGVNIDLEDYVVPGAGAQCTLLPGIDEGKFPDTLPPAPLDQHPTIKSMRPIWTCYLSRNGVPDAGNIVWSAGVCPTVDPNGVEANMSPNGITVGKMTQDSTNKVAVTGAAAYVDGIWTMERFVQTQLAIWEAEGKGLKAYIAAITNRAKSVTKVTPASLACVATPVTRNECTLGRYVTEFSAPQFGYSKCQFWLTRFATAALDLVRVKANSVTCGTPFESFTGWSNTHGYPGPYDTAAAAAAASGSTLNALLTVSPGGLPMSYSLNAPPGGGEVSRLFLGNASEMTERMDAYNKGIDVQDFGIGAVESPYCEITGWTYTKADNTTGTVAAGACVSPTIYPTTGGTKPGGIKPSVATKDGSYCGQAFNGATVEGDDITWPTQTISLPPGSFLLQKGSAAPVYPTFEGSLVYDLQLKKWGKMKLRYKQLLDYSPVNSTLNGVVPSDVFGIMAGALLTNGKITLFDQYPTDSYISYGKVGYYRHGMTSPEEVIVQFRTLCTGELKVETSLNGKNLGSGLVVTQTYTAADMVHLTGAYPGRWCNIEISGIYDISYIEYRGFIQGRR